MSEIEIDSDFTVLEPTVPDFGERAVKNEPMLFNCDLPAAMRLGGPLTSAVLERVPDHWKAVPLVIDSRVHMLMPGWYPCIPGWHHDDVPRTRADGQPNYAPDQDRSEHLVCLINGGICPTAFATGRARFAVPAAGRTVYRDWHAEVDRAIGDGRLRLSLCPSNRLVRFDDRTWHTGTQAERKGWRFFIRVSRYRSPHGAPIPRGNERTNEVRRQVQVYMDNPTAGW